MILGDSHGRGLSKLIASRLMKYFQVQSFLKLGGSILNITQNISEKRANFDVNDYLFLQCGINDLDHCFYSNSVRHIIGVFTDLMENTGHTNVIISTIPFRFDRTEYNGLIEHINRRLYTVAKRYSHIEIFIINSILHRRCYTNHGLHLNDIAKGIVCDHLKDYFMDSMKWNCSRKTLTEFQPLLMNCLLTRAVPSLRSPLDRRLLRMHGGVSIFTRVGLDCCNLDLTDYCVEIDIEFCGICLPETGTAVICLYRSCNGHFSVFIDRLEELLHFLSDKYNKIILTGDFNINFLTHSNSLLELKTLIAPFNVDIIINQPTRVSAGGGSCIDNILTNLNVECYETFVFDPCLSDYKAQALLANITCSYLQPPSQLKRCFTVNNIKKFSNSLNDMDWSLVFNDVLINIFL